MPKNHNSVLVDKNDLAKLRGDLRKAKAKITELEAELASLKANQLNIALGGIPTGEVMVSGPGQDCGCA